MFGQHLIQTGKIEREFGMLLREEKEEREISDYDVFEEFKKERAQQRVVDARKFVERIKRFLETCLVI